MDDITEQVKIMAQQIARLESRVAKLEQQTTQPDYFRDDPDLHTIIALGPDGAREFSAQKRSRERRQKK